MVSICLWIILYDYSMCITNTNSGSAWRFYHFIPKLTHSIDHLVEDSTHCLNGPSK